MTPAQAEWARCREWIKAGHSAGARFESLDDIERKIEEGSYQFWSGPNAAAVTEVQIHSEAKVLAVLYAGGSLDALVDELEPGLIQFGALMGCTGLMVVGRKGWERIGKPLGYELAAIVIIKKLPDVSGVMN